MSAGIERELVLASGSPRRAKILRDLGVKFRIEKTDAPETCHPDDPVRTVRENALAKGRAAAAAEAARAAGDGGSSTALPPRILSADTIVWFNGRIYGKPRDLEEARAFLRELGGKTHTVFTGVALDGDVRVAESRVTFRELDDAAIDEYVERVRPTDRAGAYDIDESGDLVVAGWTGSYENIMGLPVEPLQEWGLVPRRRSVLLHACCGPCASACVPRLKDEGFEVGLLFANSNIDTREEFEKRRRAAETLAAADGVPFFAAPYDHAEWLREVAAGFEDAPEQGERCARCFRYNLRKTAEFAAANGFDSFSTSLTVSPHKRSASVFAASDDPRFLREDFKKREGFKLSVRRAAELSLYRQDYCGCEFSRRQARTRPSGGGAAQAGGAGGCNEA